MNRERKRLRGKIEQLISAIAPLEWFDDSHKDGNYSRCCELRDAIMATIEGMIEVYEEKR